MANPEDLGRYRLKRLLGRGALGEVWAADDLELPGNKVAVKIMHAAEEELTLARIQFAREGRLASMLRHPNLGEIYDAGEAAGTSFLVMELVEGRSLRKLRGESLPLEDRLRWVVELADALLALHRIGIAHRDLKPANVIIRPDGRACLVDLGIAKWVRFDLGHVREDEDEFGLDAPPPSANLAVEYVPPEATDDALYDELGDQYAWGVLAYELLAGHPPELGALPLTDLASIPPHVARAVDRARAADRDARFDTMEAVLRALGFVAASVPPPPPTPPAPAPTSPLPPPPIPAAEAPLLAPAAVVANPIKRNIFIGLAVGLALGILVVLLMR